MLKWTLTSRDTRTSTSGLPGTTPVGEIENYVSSSRSAAWPTYDDISTEQTSEVKWSKQWEDDSDDDRESLSAYNDNSSTLEQMMSIDFNDDSQV